MSVLPHVERELMRVAREPQPIAASAPGAARRSWLGSGVVRSLPAAGLALIVLAAVAVGGVFVAGLRSGHGAGGSGPALGRGTGSSFPGAPTTQRGDWHGESVCPLARPNRYLPPHSGCVSVTRADMYGDGRSDLVLVYARLSDRKLGQLYVPRYFSLKVVRPGGASVRTRLKPDQSDPVILFAGRAGFDRAASVFIVNQQISSGSSAIVYSVAQGRLVPAGVSLAFGGDSADKATFACRAGPSPTILQRTWVLSRGGENGWWRWSVQTFAWRGPRLVRTGRSSVLRHGAVVPSPPGEGCVRVIKRQVRGTNGVAVTAPSQPSGVCAAGHLLVTIDPNPIQVTQQQGEIFAIENRSNRACSLTGYPRIALITGARLLPFVYRHGGGPAVTTAPPRRVELRPGGRAYLEVVHNSCVGRTSARALKTLITLPGGGGTVVAALVRTGSHELDYCASRSDPGNLVTVSALEPTIAALAFGSKG
jgi:hypothetical protein